MTNLAAARPEKLERLRCDAYRLFGPMLLREALHLLSQTHGEASLDRFERAMVARIDAMEFDVADLDGVKEFAAEQLYAVVKEARALPDHKQPLENLGARRTQGRSEDRITLEEQLQEGLEDSFPASDPPSVVSTTISGCAKDATSPAHPAEKPQG